MSLGERVEVTIEPKWAYKKGGLQDSDGKYIVPPNATLIFDLQLMRVADKHWEPKDKDKERASGERSSGERTSEPKSPALAPISPPRSPALAPSAGVGQKAPRSPKSPASVMPKKAGPSPLVLS